MEKIGTREARACFFQLLRNLGGGKKYLITRRGKPVARLLPAAPEFKPPPESVIQALLNFRTKTPCHDIPLEDVRQAIDESHRQPV